MPGRSKVAKEWFEKGKHDIDGAKILFAEKHCTDTIAVLIQQAVEKYLKGFLLYYGWKLEKIHDLVRLLAEASRYRKDLLEFEEPCRRISEYYFESRYPGRMQEEYTVEEMEGSLEIAEQIIKRIEETVGK
jgi:HEPN domain-containing protein